MASFKKMIVNNTDYDVDDPNDVETDGGELADTVINYDSATTPTIGSFTQFLDRFTSGTKVGAWFKNFRAGCEFLLHIGSLVNNCVSDNEALPLAAAQGKVLMDLITDANATIEENKSDLQSQITQINNDLSDLNTSIKDITNEKTLWNGTATEGDTITLSESCFNFRFIIILTTNSAPFSFAVTPVTSFTPQYLYGGNVIYRSNNPTLNFFRATVDGNNLTIDSSNYIPQPAESSNGKATSITINEILGFMRCKS